MCSPKLRMFIIHDCSRLWYTTSQLGLCSTTVYDKYVEQTEPDTASTHYAVRNRLLLEGGTVERHSRGTFGCRFIMLLT